ncbi:tryptophan synthase subunit alpha [Thermodesulforhabdus norvegica]|uniref:Tryptophan synthase alpha chain n=1 Tax=Thermodesulforhabdus norvegica TaxID=39841 RepID=A0A1I4U6R5_9BACT|nr:tryptophan synthase subunit alpha [Thermodesulforhabdus norvegica]SFM84672.1 tryptophan synthase, alpha chain [Thermodesulforhabdus norvegica]
MSRISELFERLKKRKEKALVGFVTAGDPDFDRSLEIILAMCRSGVDILELGVPFSDPTADGPVIQRASQRALKNGMTLRRVLELAGKIREQSDVPLVLFSYYNPLFKYGAERIYRAAVETGIDGMLVVDLPPEEAREFLDQWPGNDIDFIRLIAPTTPAARISAIVKDASGFIYLISKTGVTGSEGVDYGEVSQMVQQVKERTDLPVCVGFGISRADQVKAISSVADGVVIGSAFVKTIEEGLVSGADIPYLIAEQTRKYKEAQWSS